MTWDELSLENFQASRQLLEARLYRSSISRSYYAVYAASTEALSVRGTQFPQGRNNPSHEQLPALISHNLNLPDHQRREMAAAVRRLRSGRIAADYLPEAYLDSRVALALLRDAARVLRLLGVLQ